MTAAPRMLIFGSRGFLGGWMAAAAARRFDVVAAEGEERADIRDASACRRVMEAVRPEIVVLTAAISDIDRCEREPQSAEAVNVGGPANIARECARMGARLLFTSSGAVFDGTQAAYDENDTPAPVSVYGWTKLRAERAVASLLPEAVVVRLSLVIGLAHHSGTNALLNRLLACWAEGLTVEVPADEYRNALDAATLATMLVELAANPGAVGIYHAGSANALSRLEIACGLAQAFGYSRELVQPQLEAAVGRAPRGTVRISPAGQTCGLLRTIGFPLANKRLKGALMQLPKAIHELEYTHGSIYGEEEKAALLEVLEDSAPSCGPRVKAFEEAFAGYCGVSHALAVTSATAGLQLALMAAGVGPGDEVITTPLTWISTANAAAGLGATVVFADVDRRTLNLDPASVEGKITARTKVILPVHLYGQCCDMDALEALAKPRGILVVDDCAHAAGSGISRPQSGLAGRYLRVQLSPAEKHGHAGRRRYGHDGRFRIAPAHVGHEVSCAAARTIPRASIWPLTRPHSPWASDTGISISMKWATTSA